MTVQLQDAAGNILKTTVTSSAPTGYMHPYANGYYQFTHVCLDVTHRVAIDVNQPFLTGYVPTITGQGTQQTDINVNPFVVTLSAANKIDHTIDFGFRSYNTMTVSFAGAT